MEKKICALELASYLVRLDWTVYVSCSSYVEVDIHLDVIDVTKLRRTLKFVADIYHFTFDFTDRSDLELDFYVCHCRF